MGGKIGVQGCHVRFWSLVVTTSISISLSILLSISLSISISISLSISLSIFTIKIEIIRLVMTVKIIKKTVRPIKMAKVTRQQ